MTEIRLLFIFSLVSVFSFSISAKPISLKNLDANKYLCSGVLVGVFGPVFQEKMLSGKITKTVFDRQLDDKIVSIVLKMMGMKTKVEKLNSMKEIMNIKDRRIDDFLNKCEPAFQKVVSTCKDKLENDEDYSKCIEDNKNKMDRDLVNTLTDQYQKNFKKKAPLKN